MDNRLFKTVNATLKYWYMPLIIGVIFIITGIYTLTSPMESFVALSIFFSITFIFTGILEIVFSISNRKKIDNWGWNLTFGLITLILGVLLIVNPGLSMVTMPLYIGFLILFRSVSAIAYAADLKNYGVLDWGNLMLVGVLGVIFSFILIWNPVFAGMTIVFWTGLAILTSGVFSVYVSYKLKGLKNKASDTKKQEV